MVSVEFASNVLSREWGPGGLLEDSVKGNKNRLRLSKIAQCGGSSGGSNVFKIIAPHRAQAFIEEWFSCGSGGCTVSYSLLLKETDAKATIEKNKPCK